MRKAKASDYWIDQSIIAPNMPVLFHLQFGFVELRISLVWRYVRIIFNFSYNLKTNKLRQIRRKGFSRKCGYK